MGIVSSLGLKSSNHFALASVASLKDRKSTRLNSSHDQISYAVFCLKKKKKIVVVLHPPLDLVLVGGEVAAREKLEGGGSLGRVHDHERPFATPALIEFAVVLAVQVR